MKTLKQMVNEWYWKAKCKAKPFQDPELFPKEIVSDQAKAIVFVFERKINSLEKRIKELESRSK